MFLNIALLFSVVKYYFILFNVVKVVKVVKLVKVVKVVKIVKVVKLVKAVKVVKFYLCGGGRFLCFLQGRNTRKNLDKK